LEISGQHSIVRGKGPRVAFLFQTAGVAEKPPKIAQRRKAPFSEGALGLKININKLHVGAPDSKQNASRASFRLCVISGAVSNLKDGAILVAPMSHRLDQNGHKTMLQSTRKHL
jgi:hypothetical protein